MPPRGRSPSGLILVDKPAGPSSFAIVAQIRRRTGARTGHAGTLDPFATGLLLVLSGDSTKLASCFVGLDKRYLTDVDLTARTDTGDREGEVVDCSDAPPADELDVSAIARKSNGGGHRQAAGFSSDDSVEEITDFIHREFRAAAGA